VFACAAVAFVLAGEPARLAAEPPLPEGNAYVRSLVAGQRRREEAVNKYTYDVEEVSQELDSRGGVTKVETKRYEVFHVRGRAVRKLVAQNGRPLSLGEAEAEERRVRERVGDIASDRTVQEMPEVRLSQVLERYDFKAVRREERDERPTLIFDFEPLPGDRKLEGDFFLRKLRGRIVVDEAERQLVEADLTNSEPIKLAFGLGASVESVSLRLVFRPIEDGLWLPSRVHFGAEGRALLAAGFKVRTVVYFSRFRRFEAETESETVTPPKPKP
jgi:hypothetical protein